MAEKSLENLIKEYNGLVKKSQEFNSPFKPRKLTDTKPVTRGDPVLYFEGYFECIRCGKKVKCLIGRPVKKLNTYFVVADNMIDGTALLCEECQKKELKEMIKRVKNFIEKSKEEIKLQAERKQKIEEIKRIKEEYQIP